MSNMEVHFTSNTDLWSTPQATFDKYHAIHKFELDVCATNENRKCEKFFTPEQDGLKQSWGGLLDEPTIWA